MGSWAMMEKIFLLQAIYKPFGLVCSDRPLAWEGTCNTLLQAQKDHVHVLVPPTTSKTYITTASSKLAPNTCYHLISISFLKCGFFFFIYFYPVVVILPMKKKKKLNQSVSQKKIFLEWEIRKYERASCWWTTTKSIPNKLGFVFFFFNFWFFALVQCAIMRYNAAAAARIKSHHQT